MSKFLLSKAAWRKVDTVLGFGIALVVTMLGAFATHLFITTPPDGSTELEPTAIVMGLGILAIGLSMMAVVFVRTKRAYCLCFANIFAWFFVYGTALNLSSLYKGDPFNWATLGFSLAYLAVACGSAYMFRRIGREVGSK